MNNTDNELEQRIASRLMDVLIRAALIFLLAMLSYRIFAPFLSLMVWAAILAVTLYPLHQAMASRLGGKQGLAATLIVLLGLVLIVAPTAVLMGSPGRFGARPGDAGGGQHTRGAATAGECGRLADRG